MPDPSVETPELELGEIREVPRDRAPIHPEAGYHEFIESEFPNGKGRCGTCGGGPDADIHKKPVDQLERIGDALERIAHLMEVEFEARLERSRMSLWERIRGVL